MEGEGSGFLGRGTRGQRPRANAAATEAGAERTSISDFIGSHPFVQISN